MDSIMINRTKFNTFECFYDFFLDVPTHFYICTNKVLLQ